MRHETKAMVCPELPLFGSFQKDFSFRKAIYVLWGFYKKPTKSKNDKNECLYCKEAA
jgi:hypothetical protein